MAINPGGIKHLTNSIRNNSQVPIKTAEALENIQNQVNTIGSDVNTLSSAATVTAAPSAVTVMDIVVSVATTNIVPIVSASTGAQLIVVITEDATGLRQITWDAQFKAVTVEDIDTRPNMVNIYLFFGRSDGNWWLICSNLGN